MGRIQVRRASRSGASEFEILAVERLKSRGLRVTRPRLSVLEALANAPRPLNAYGLRDEIVASGGDIDVVSVYRTLSTLESEGLVHRVGIADGFVACRLGSDHDDASEHLVCPKCGKSEEIRIDAATTIALRGQLATLGRTGVKIQIEVSSPCVSCEPAL